MNESPLLPLVLRGGVWFHVVVPPNMPKPFVEADLRWGTTTTLQLRL